MKRAFGFLLAAGIILGATAAANADTITFGGSGVASSVGDFIDANGYRFTLSAAPSYSFLEIISTPGALETGLFAANHSEVTMTQIGGGAFSLNSLDLGGSWVSYPDRWADHVDIISGGNTFTVNLPGNDPTQHTVSPDFQNVTSVLFRPYGNVNGGVNNFEFTVDNLVVGQASVPEPSTLLLIGSGMTGLVAMRRFKSRK